MNEKPNQFFFKIEENPRIIIKIENPRFPKKIDLFFHSIFKCHSTQRSQYGEPNLHSRTNGGSQEAEGVCLGEGL